MTNKQLIHEALDEYEATREATVRRCLDDRETKQYTQVCSEHFAQAAQERGAAREERVHLSQAVDNLRVDVHSLMRDTSRLVRELDDQNGDGVLSQVKILIERDRVRQRTEESAKNAYWRLVVMVAGAAIIGSAGWILAAAVTHWGLI